MNKSKKIISIVAAATLTLSTLSLTACRDKTNGVTLTPGFVAGVKDDVKSNGGFVVEKGNYVYFINGKESNTADNTYGKAVKGALMRMSKSDIAAGNYKAETVVPSLFVSGNYDSGIYIFGDYVYYATPTTDKNNAGEIANTSLDFKMAKLDGSEAPKGGKDGYFFRLTSNAVKYRYVNVGDVVYCLYEDESKLKSYNTSTGATTVLASGAGTFYYDVDSLDSPNVYYTMSVSEDIDQENPTSMSYNQIYCVNASATATTDAATASYTVYEGGAEIAKYDFDENALKAKAEEEGEDSKYDAKDYTTYPYVNLGKLVLDGIGSSQDYPSHQLVNAGAEAKAAAGELQGYTYTIQSQTNGGLYFTRTPAKGSDGAKLYYLSNTRDASWNTVLGNNAVELVSSDTTKASATALYDITDANTHVYYYVSGTTLKKVEGATEITLAEELASGVTLWKVEGDYLYYYGTGTNGKSLSRINVTGSADDYKEMFLKYEAETISLVDFSDGWYKPEFVAVDGKTMVWFANAEAYGAGSESFNYVYGVDLTDVAARNAEIEKVNEYIDEYKDNSEAQAVMKYYFATGSLTSYEKAEIKKLYDEKTQQKYIADFVAEFAKEGGFKLRNSYLPLIGAINETDAEAMETAWADSLKKETVTDSEDKGLETWAIVLIVCGGVLVVAAAVLVPVLVHLKKKEAKAKREEAIINAYKHKKIDTTDDKSIDVYADDKPEETTEEVSEAPVEETTEEVSEAPAAEEAPQA